MHDLWMCKFLMRYKNNVQRTTSQIMRNDNRCFR